MVVVYALRTLRYFFFVSLSTIASPV